MKSLLYDSLGKKKSEIELPEAFSSTIREDIASKYFEAEKFVLKQPFSTFDEAGKRHSASGTISHRRHKWKGHYGRGIARLPRKTMWRRGTQFFWIGAEVSQARGGRVAHPPKGIYTLRKINKKERKIALYSAFASTFNKNFISKRYSSLSSPVSSAVIESLPSKTKELLALINSIFGNISKRLIRRKEVRAGKGKSRGRKYKSSAGLLIITADNEKAKCTVLEIKSLKNLKMKDLYPLGRITLYTKNALDQINNLENKESLAEKEAAKNEKKLPSKKLTKKEVKK